MQRLLDAPLLHVSDDAALQGNVNGPSLIRAPAWVQNPPAAYYLYFAHHLGTTIRLALADAPTGPWRLHVPGALRLADSLFPTEEPNEADLHPRVRQIVAAGFDDLYAHIASPDVLVLPELEQVRMYYHGRHSDGRQLTRVATSPDGISFTARPELLGPSYFRVFRYGDWWYALSMPGLLLRSRDGLSGFESGPTLFDRNMRHSAVRVRADTQDVRADTQDVRADTQAAGGDQLDVWWTQVGEAPERIYHGVMDLSGDWRQWQTPVGREVLRPERAWEGADAPLAASRRGAVLQPVNELRDPCVFEHHQQTLLLYAVAGEQGIGICRI